MEHIRTSSLLAAAHSRGLPSAPRTSRRGARGWAHRVRHTRGGLLHRVGGVKPALLCSGRVGPKPLARLSRDSSRALLAFSVIGDGRHRGFKTRRLGLLLRWHFHGQSQDKVSVVAADAAGLYDQLHLVGDKKRQTAIISADAGGPIWRISAFRRWSGESSPASLLAPLSHKFYLSWYRLLARLTTSTACTCRDRCGRLHASLFHSSVRHVK